MFRQYPYNINKATQGTVMEVLGSPVDAQVAEIKAQRALVAGKLTALPAVRKVWPSEANFLLVKVDDADAAYSRLIDGGIIVRNRSRVPGCSGCLRITIGTPEENVKLIELMGTL